MRSCATYRVRGGDARLANKLLVAVDDGWWCRVILKPSDLFVGGGGGLRLLPLLLLFGLPAQGPGPDAQHVVHHCPGHHRLGYALGEFDSFHLRVKNYTRR